MRKGFTAVEILIILVIAGMFSAVIYVNVTRFMVDRKCNAQGYVSASSNRYSRYCSKVENGNTIVIHVDSIGRKN